MSTAYQPLTTEQHAIEQRGDQSYWVMRYVKSPQYSCESFSRVVFFARSKDEAENYIRRYSRLNR